jgi:RimJ/RimL family protein N-acetyltransferase
MMSSVLDLPAEIETERLVIRPHRPGDGRALFEAVVESLEDLRRWPASMGWALSKPSEADSEAFCRHCASEFEARRDFPLLLLERATGVVVGSSGLHRPDWSVPKMEIGWWGRSSHRGRGLVTEGARAIVAFGFEQLGARRIFALPDEENVTSSRICERIGMQLEGTIRNDRADPTTGTLRHSRLFAATR